MDNATRSMINSLAQDILDSFHIQIPIQDLNQKREELSGGRSIEMFFSFDIVSSTSY